MYPRLVVNLNHLAQNVNTIQRLCQQHQIQIVGITKVFRGDANIATVLVENGLTMLGDSRVSNLKRLSSIQAEKWLIRPPMPSEIDDVIRYCDVSLNSELSVMEKLNAAAQKQGRKHKVILMADLGDIREGYADYEELLAAARQVEAFDALHLYGIGTNLTCFSFVQASTEKMEQLAVLAEQISNMIGRPLELISGGNSATIRLMLQKGIPNGVNSLRLGEAILFGKERAGFTFLPETHQDVFILECEIVELKDKPSMPWGEIGTDSYGNTPTFCDLGIRQKAICALGRQDFDPETTVPVDPGVRLLGASSDHLMLDVSDSKRQYQVGDIVQLQLGYFSTLRAFTSSDVEKVYFDTESLL